MSLLFNMLPRLVIAFLPRSKYLLILWLQSPSTVILEPKKIKSVTVSIYLYIYKLDLPPNEKSYLLNWKVFEKVLKFTIKLCFPLLGLIFKISRMLQENDRKEKTWIHYFSPQRKRIFRSFLPSPLKMESTDKKF